MVWATESQEVAVRRAFRRRALSGLLVLGLLASSAAAKYGGGTGAFDNPYRIETVEHLVELSENTGDWTSDFKLMNDLDMADVNEGAFKPIGYFEGPGYVTNRPFTGRFDGNGRTISNLAIRDMENEYVGMFSYMAVGQVHNLRLVRATVVGGGSGTGALVGYLDGANAQDCSAEHVQVSGNLRVGALLGRVSGGVARCSSSGRVTGGRYVGGLIGAIDEGNTNQCYSTADAIGDHDVGGLAGVALDEFSAVTNCYAKGDVEGTQYVGGLLGALGSARAGQCYATGSVVGNQAVGGLIGAVFQGTTIRCYWDVESSGQTESAGPERGRLTAEMQSWETYFGWDWQNVWTICEGMNTPVFWWQIPDGDMRCPDGVDLIDFAVFAQHWRERFCGPPNNCGGADFNGSGAVNALDLAILARNWLVGTE